MSATIGVALWRLFSPRRKLQLLALVVVMLLSAAAEVLSLATVLPFLSVLSDPRRLWGLAAVRGLAQQLQLTAADQLLLPVTLLFALMMVLAAALRLANLWLNGRLAAAIGADLSARAYAGFLYLPYAAHTRGNSSDILALVTHKTTRSVDGINACLQLCTGVVIVVGLLAAFLWVDWRLALAALGCFAALYLLIGLQARRRLSRNGQLASEAQVLQIRAIQEGIGAIRDVLLDGLQPLCLATFARTNLPLRRYQMQNQFLEKFPRFFVEAVAMIAMAFFAWVLVRQGGGGVGVIPLLGTFALGSQRLLPALQQIYANWALLRSCTPDLAALVAVLQQPVTLAPVLAEPLEAWHTLDLRQVSFGYSAEHPTVLHNLDLTLHRGECLGLIGSTGSGKSTLIDLLMGLLSPTTGQLLLDHQDLHDPARRSLLAGWRAAIAHVPQSIYLVDGSIGDNIAFGVPRDQIDWDRVRRAARQAQIANFIEADPRGYGAPVGERGIQLSGGQRQRIGLARALYKPASLLVLDEATSALDTDTEAAVIAALQTNHPNLTVVMIAHRFNTLRHCDRILRLERGAIAAVGTPAALLQNG
jgi:ATP-binding cassette subfamily B protein